MEKEKYHGHQCRECRLAYSRKQSQNYYQENKDNVKQRTNEYKKNNKEKIKEDSKFYYIENKDRLILQRKEYKEKNIEVFRERERKRTSKYKKTEKGKATTKKYNETHKEQRRQTINKSTKARKDNNKSLAIRTSISSLVAYYLKKNGSSKNNKSCMDYMPWQHIDNLWAHLELQFALPANLTADGKIWMTRENRGKYSAKTWDDNDPSTWTWQLDHIIPQSDLPYSSMEEENFKKCWSLENLRPLGAKQNWFDGVYRTRHKKKGK